MNVLVAGAGMNGLATALLLAKDGHSVTVVERDPSAPPAADRVWDSWERRGVSQFRMPNFLQPRWREILDDVAIQARIPDRYRRFVRDGTPVATGVLAVGDSWACTNPSLGRGITIGLIHSVGLRDLLRTDLVDEPYKLALAWDDVTESTVTPWFQATVGFDRHRLAEIAAQITGDAYEPGDAPWEVSKALSYGARCDSDILRGLLRLGGLLRTPQETFASPGFVDKVMEVGGDWRSSPAMGPTRAELLDVVQA